MSNSDKFDHLTILHSLSSEAREKVEAAHLLTQKAEESLKIVLAFTERLKASVNLKRQEAFAAACDEYPALADPNNACNLDFETGLIVTPKTDVRDPSKASLEMLQRLIDSASAGGDVRVHPVIAKSPQEAIQKIQEQIANEDIEFEIEDDEKKIIN